MFLFCVEQLNRLLGAPSTFLKTHMLLLSVLSLRIYWVSRGWWVRLKQHVMLVQILLNSLYVKLESSAMEEYHLS